MALFQHHEKKMKPVVTKPLHDLIAVVTPTALLVEGKRDALLQRITESSALKPEQFDTFCLTLLHDFASRCQNLPETSNSFYSLPGGLLFHALNRTEAALHLFRQFLVRPEAELSEKQKLWLYALFSASILQGIGKLSLDYRIELFDKKGQLLKQWNPLLETLGHPGQHYNYTFLNNDEDELRRRLNIVLAYQLMPKKGFDWIAEHAEVLAIWLALLHEDTHAASILGAILERADAIAIQRDVVEFLHRQTHTGGTTRPGRISTFIDTPVESGAEKERLLGAEFIAWLSQALNKGIVTINKDLLVMMPGGLAAFPELFQLFLREHPEGKKWQNVQKGLLAFGLHQRNVDGQPSRIDNPNKTGPSGIILDKYSVVLPEKVHLYSSTTGQTTVVSAMELMHMQKSPDSPSPMHLLAASGEWEAPTVNPGFLDSGYKFRE